MSCGITGTAALVESPSGAQVWIKADRAIHVSREAMDDLEVRNLIAAKYAVGEWCDNAGAFHAHRKEMPPRSE